MTVSAMKMLGKVAYHHDCRKSPLACACDRIVPHDQLVGSPRPRKARPASARIAEPATNDRLMKMGGAALGRMCRKRMRSLRTPTVRAASTKSAPRRRIASARTTRAVGGQLKTPITIEIVVRLGEKTEASKIVNGRIGSVRKMSI